MENLEPDKRYQIEIPCKFPNLPSIHCKMIILEDLYGLQRALGDDNVEGEYIMVFNKDKGWVSCSAHLPFKSCGLDPIFTEKNVQAVREWLSENHPNGWSAE